MIYVGLDLAATTGVAVLNLENKTVYSFEIEKTSNNYYEKIIFIQEEIFRFLDLLKCAPVVTVEEFVYFAKSRKTQNQLMKLYGYVFLSLYTKDVDLREMKPLSARKISGFSGKLNKKSVVQQNLNFQFRRNLSNNETDAIVLCIASAINDGAFMDKDVPLLTWVPNNYL